MGGVPCWREFATSSLAASTPRSRSSAGKRQRREDAGGEGAGARRGLDAAEQFERGVVEELRVAARAGGVLEDEDRHVVVVLGRDAQGADQPVADHLGRALAPDSARSRAATPSSMSSPRRSTRPSV